MISGGYAPDEVVQTVAFSDGWLDSDKRKPLILLGEHSKFSRRVFSDQWQTEGTPGFVPTVRLETQSLLEKHGEDQAKAIILENIIQERLRQCPSLTRYDVMPGAKSTATKRIKDAKKKM